MGRNDSDSAPIISCLPIHFLIDCIAVGTGNGSERHIQAGPQHAEGSTSREQEVE